MDRAEQTESAESAVQDLALLVAQHVEASDARLARLEANLLKLSDALGACVQSIHEFVDPATARLARTEETLETFARNMARIEQELATLKGATTVERGNTPPKG